MSTVETLDRELSREVKRAAIRDLVALGWSDVRIARAVGVSDRTVRTIRSQMGEVDRRIRRMASERDDLGGRVDVRV